MKIKYGKIPFIVLMGFLSVLLLLIVSIRSAETGKESTSGGIPAVSIIIEPREYENVINSPNHSYRTGKGSVRIELPAGYENEFGNTNPDCIGVDLPLEFLRGRGNSTWLSEKKSFKFKLNKKTDILGMGKSKHWVLVSDTYDASLLRNRIMFSLGRKYGLDYSPRLLPVDLYINGEYLGSYTLGQGIRVGKAGIAIDEIPPEVESGAEITGGYLLAMNPYPGELPGNTFKTSRGVRFLLKFPEFETEDPEDQTGSTAQREYITGYLQDAENAIFNDDPAWTEYMDMESAAKYWWLQQLCVNGDAYRSDSTYLYKPREGKLFWGPLWDFDIAMNPAIYEDSFNYISMPWLDYLRANDASFREMLLRTWSELDPILEEMLSDGGMIDRYANEIRVSWERNNALWHSGSGASENGLDIQVTELKQFIRRRRASIKARLDLLGEVNVNLPQESDKVAAGRPEATAIPAAGGPEATAIPDAGRTEETAIPGAEPDDLAGGISGTCCWRIDANGHMTIRPLNGEDGTLGSWTVPAERPWHLWMNSITGVSFRGTVHPQTCLAMFYHCYNLKEIDLTGLDTSGVKIMRGMFAWCWNLEKLDVSVLNTSSATNMREMFLACNHLTDLDLSAFDFSCTANTQNMFYRCHHLKHILLPGKSASAVTDMSGMFADCYELRSLDLSGFDTSNVTCMRALFYRCFHLTDLNLSGIDTRHVTAMDYMFAECNSLTGLNPADFRTSNVEDMSCMFLACSNLTGLDLSGFDFSGVKNMDYMFGYCSSLKEIMLNETLDPAADTEKTNIFHGCSSLSPFDK